MIAHQMSLTDAVEARDAGLAQAEMGADATYRDALDSAIRALARSGRQFTSDTVREVCGDPPVGQHPNIAGAAFMAASRAGIIEQVGFGHSVRVVGHSNRVAVWQGVRVCFGCRLTAALDALLPGDLDG